LLSISLLMNSLFIIMFLYSRPPLRFNKEMRHVFNFNITMARFLDNFFFMAFLLYLLNVRIVQSKWFSATRWNICSPQSAQRHVGMVRRQTVGEPLRLRRRTYHRYQGEGRRVQAVGGGKLMINGGNLNKLQL